MNLKSDDTICSICLDVVETRQKKVLPCSHSYHSLCIKEWQTSSSTCPLCRNLLSQEKTFDICLASNEKIPLRITEVAIPSKLFRLFLLKYRFNRKGLYKTICLHDSTCSMTFQFVRNMHTVIDRVCFLHSEDSNKQKEPSPCYDINSTKFDLIKTSRSKSDLESSEEILKERLSSDVTPLEKSKRRELIKIVSVEEKKEVSKLSCGSCFSKYITIPCEQCFSVFYCNKRCLSKHLTLHKEECLFDLTKIRSAVSDNVQLNLFLKKF